MYTPNTYPHVNIMSTLIQYDVINSTRDLFPLQQHPWLPYRIAGKNHYSKRWRRRRNADHRCKNRQMLDAEHYVAYCLLSVQTTSIPVLTLPPVRDNKATQHILITLKSIHFDHPVRAELTMLSTRISDYPTITQGKTRIPGVNDAEELETLDVSRCSPRVLQLSAPHQGPSGRQLPVQITPQAVRISPHQLRV